MEEGSVGFNPATLTPTHRLVLGLPGQSAGLAMAQRLGVPEAIIERARQALADEEQETAKFLDSLHAKVAEAEDRERKVALAEKRLAEREKSVDQSASGMEDKIKGEMERRFHGALRRAEAANRQALDEALETMKARAASRRGVAQSETSAARVHRKAQETFTAALNETLGIEPEEQQAAKFVIEPGIEVKLASFGTRGRVLRQVGDEAWEVQVGQLKMRVAGTDMSPCDEQPAAQSRLPSGVTYSSEVKSRASLTEINVIGQTVDEASEAVDKFLDEAVLAEVERLRVVHGFGTNALRNALWKMFAGHVHVEKYYAAE
jgi:DNA mismatch repair protein MutS2